MSVSTVYVTTSTREEANQIGRTVVSEELAACANILGQISSIYTWQGKIMEELETAMFLKTRSSLITPLSTRITELHSYDCPCIIALDIVGGNSDFIDWIANETGNRN